MFRLTISGNFFLILRDSDQQEHLRHPRKDVSYIIFDEEDPNHLIRFKGLEKDLKPKLSNQLEFRFNDLRDSSGTAFADFDTLTDSFLDTNLGNSSGGSSGGTGTTTRVFTGANLAAAESARDTYYTANPSERVEGTTIILNYGVDPNFTAQKQFWNGTAWVNLGGGMSLTGAEIAALLYAEPNTNRLQDDEELSLRTLTDFVNERFIPRKFGANQYVNSSLQEFDNRIVSSKSIQTPDGSLFLGAQRLSNAGFGVLLTNMASNETSYPVGVDLLTEGSSVPFYWNLGGIVPTPAAADRSETFTANQVQFIAPSVANGIALTYSFDSVIDTTDVNLVIRLNSHTDPNPIFDYKRATGGTGFDMTTGDNTLTLPVPLFFENGQQLYTTVESSNGLSLRGQTLGGQTIPYVAVTGRVAVKELIATQNWVRNLIGGGQQTEGRITSFRIQGQGTTVNTPFTLTGNQTFQFSLNNPSLFTGNLTLSQDGTTLISNILPTTSSVATTVNDVTLTNVGDSTTFTLSGTTTAGTTVSSNYTIHAAGSGELVYYGTSSTENPNGVPLAALQSHIVGTGTFDVSTGPVTNGDFFIILVPADHDVHSIRDTILQEPVTTIFRRTQEVRIINTISYHSYVIGPLGADANGETYTLNLL